jgi:tRNA-dihydrouridine synthase B
LFVNGDVIDAQSASRAMAASGADGVMIGRGAMGQPWIFAKLLGRPLPNTTERLDVIDRHLAMMHEFYGDEAGARIARKHMQAYLQRWSAGQLTSSFMALTDGRAQREWLREHREMLVEIAQSAAPQVGAQIPVAA